MSVVCIADLHLHAFAPATLELACRFIRTALQGVTELYILGDLFEVWVGDDDPADWSADFTAALRNLSQHGTAVHLMHGNRDFLIGEQFAEQLGAKLHREDSLTITLGTRRALLMHGDTLCTDDTDYIESRRTLREPAWQQDFLAKPLTERHERARALRAQSREKTARKDLASTDANPDTCLDELRAARADWLIHGHTHRPSTHDCGDGKRYVLGEWLPNGAVIASLDERGVDLLHWPIDSE